MNGGMALPIRICKESIGATTSMVPRCHSRATTNAVKGRQQSHCGGRGFGAAACRTSGLLDVGLLASSVTGSPAKLPVNDGSSAAAELPKLARPIVIRSLRSAS
tara:strand:+ start:1421 stop:1732 length:312 start_codon:yes stop_codon:yes gene_type:complete